MKDFGLSFYKKLVKVWRIRWQKTKANQLAFAVAKYGKWQITRQKLVDYFYSINK